MRDNHDIPDRIGNMLRYGRIASVDLSAGRITVAVGEIETQPIRWATGGSGGTRVWSRPKIGEQVVLLCPDGDITGAFAMRGLDCDAFPPLGDPDRELVEFEDGATIGYDPDAHALAVVLPAGAIVSIVAPGGVTIDTDVRITGDLIVDKDVKAAGVSLRHHQHLQVQPGQGVSGEPKA
jgi:phage baseplate assembly protein V